MSASRDVRMRGFARRTRVEDAVAWVDAHAVPLPAERAPLSEAAGRVLATAVESEVDAPPFRRAMMDGYAVRAADTLGASPYNRLTGGVIVGASPNRRLFIDDLHPGIPSPCRFNFRNTPTAICWKST
jgi:molybdopterin molybdotransferase